MGSLETRFEVLQRQYGEQLGEIWAQLLLEGYSPESIAAIPELRPPRETAGGALANLFADLRKERFAGMGPTGHQERVRRDLSVGVAVVGDQESLLDEGMAQLGRAGLNVTGVLAQAEDLVSGSTQSSHEILRDESQVILCLSSGASPSLPHAVNRLAHDYCRVVLNHNQHDLGATVGPLYVPGASSCYECFWSRRRAVLAPWETALLDGASAVSNLIPVLLAADWVVVELAKQLTGVGTPISYNRVLYVDYFNGVPEVHNVFRVPRCDVCGPHRLPDRQIWLHEDSTAPTASGHA
jgi:bacteriocin biosynthesis cyclodehydratase domain-containing protein